MPSNDPVSAWTTEQLRELGQKVKAARKARGWSQRDVADRLGAAASWISGVENAALAPGPDRLLALKMLLGLDLQADPSESSGVPTFAPYAALWRGRADLLTALADEPLRPRRLRLLQMSRDLVEAAADHPMAQTFVRNGVLASLPELAESIPDWMRRLIVVELAGMKIDAPYETGFSRDRRFRALDVTLMDLGLPQSAHAPLQEAFERFWRARFRPLWQDLEPVGGAAGVFRLKAAESDVDLALLVGHDPAGWLGFEWAAGRWLVQGAAARSSAGRFEGDRSGTTGSAAFVGPGWHAGAASTSLSTVMVGGLALGPVVGAALGAARLRSAATPSVKPRKQFGRAADDVSANEDEHFSSAAVQTAAIAESLGRHWVCAEAAKLVALYRAFPQVRRGDADAGLPRAAVVRDHLTSTAGLVRQWWKEESAASGTRSHDANERLRELANIADTLLAAADHLTG